MNRNEVKTIVIEAIKVFRKEMHGDATTPIEESTVFLGNGGIIDSLGFIQIVVDVETQFKQRGTDVLLTSKIAMSTDNSPFERVRTLIDFILEQLND